MAHWFDHQSKSETEQRYRTIVETAQEGIWQIDAEGHTTFINPRMAAMLGCSVEDCAGKSMFDFMDDDSRVEAEQNLAKRRAGVAEQHEFRFRRRDGTPLYALLSANPITDAAGNFVGALAMVADIGARVAAEQALKESEARYRSVIAAMSEGIVVQAPDGRIVACNAAAQKILGLTADQVLGRTSIDSRRRAMREDGSEFPSNEHPSMLTLRSGRACTGIVMGIHRPDDSLAWISINSQPMFNPGESVLQGVVSSFSDITEQKHTEDQLRASEANLAKAQSVAKLGSWEWDLATNEVTLSPESFRILDIPAATPADQVVDSIVAHAHPEDRERLATDIEAARRQGAMRPGEYRFVHDNGSVHYIWVEGEASRDHSGRPQKLFGAIQDITARKQTQAALANSERKWRAIFNQTFQFIGLLDPKGILLEVNETALQFARASTAEVLGRPFWETPWWSHSQELQDRLKQSVARAARGELVRIEVAHPDTNGTLHAIDFSLKPIFDEQNQVYALIAEGRDITERIQTQERLRFMAQHDALTGLPNRLLLLDRLKQALARARWRKRLVAVMFVDLDRFKTINDSLGHDAGDRLLQQLSERFRRCVRDGDTVARFGGDEFVMLLDDIANESDITAIAQKVLEALRPAFAIDQQSFYISASIGISLFPDDGDDSSTLLKHADMAMYRAKEAGKNTYQFFAAEMSSRAFERLSLETNLRNALQRDEFRVHYQPQIDVDTGTIIGVEALLRWQHPELGMVLPNEFISLAEETGLIALIGQWVLQTACAQLARWQKQGWQQLRLSVNLSPRQFQVPGLVDAINTALATTTIAPAQLELEITEGVLVSHTPAMLETLEALRALNVRLAIDDFGTGYSSLSYLRRFPIDTLKIDRSFVHDIPRDADDSAIVAAIVALAKSLKLEIVAEGVERSTQRDLLRGLGCRIMQGFFFSQPLAAEDMTKLLNEQQNKPRSAPSLSTKAPSQS